MERLVISEFSEDSIRKLYSVLYWRDKEIGDLFGVSEDAILKRRKQYGIPKNPRGSKKRCDVEVEFTGKKKCRIGSDHDSEIKELFDSGLTDSEVGSRLGVSAVSISNARRRLGLHRFGRSMRELRIHELLDSMSLEELSDMYYSNTTKSISEKLGCSKMLWLPYIRSRGIVDKGSHRVSKYPGELTAEQECLIIGSLLGDGGIDEFNRFFEFHSNKQLLYLEMKRSILLPYSGSIYDAKGGKRFNTTMHPVFSKYRDLFYKNGVRGKHIPVDYISKVWGDSILAYWFFDDGNLCEDGTCSIANLSPDFHELERLSLFINKRYGWSTWAKRGSSVNKLIIPSVNRDAFFMLVSKFATPDLFYKLPESFVVGKTANAEIFMLSLNSKVYRNALNNEEKARAECLLFQKLREGGFPYPKLTEERRKHLLNSFITSVSNLYELKGTLLSGTQLAESFFDNIYSCNRRGHRPPIVEWLDDSSLKKLVKNRLKHADSLTPSAIRKGIKLTFKGTVSNYRPQVAAYVYKKYGVKDVLDYSCGFGSRMLAARAVGLNYTGIEPNPETYSNLINMSKWLDDSKCPGRTVELLCTRSEATKCLGKFDLAFSCPPYLYVEHYHDSDSQSDVRYPDTETWLSDYWEATIRNSYNMLKDGGHFAAHLSKHSCQEMISRLEQVASTLGMSKVEETTVNMPSVLQSDIRSEVIIVFKK